MPIHCFIEVLGKKFAQDCAGSQSICKAHPPMHIGICVGGCNAADEPKDNQNVSLIPAAALKLWSVSNRLNRQTG
jgi:hypothetical protein